MNASTRIWPELRCSPAFLTSIECLIIATVWVFSRKSWGSAVGQIARLVVIDYLLA